MLPETAKRLLLKMESYIRALLRNPYWWGGLILLTAFLGAGYVLVNDLLMPKLTRQGAHLQVPNVIQSVVRTGEERSRSTWIAC